MERNTCYTQTVCASAQAQPAHEAARQVQQVVHGAMHELDGLAVRREGPVGRAFGSRPARSFVCGGPRLRVDLWRPPARPLHSRRRWTTSMCSFELEPGARPREDEQVVDEPAQNTVERARIVSARESCSSDDGRVRALGVRVL